MSGTTSLNDEFVTAVCAGDLVSLTELFESHPELSRESDFAMRLLRTAISNNRVAVVEYLVRRGAEILEYSGDDPDTAHGPLCEAVASNSKDCVDWLLEHTASLEREVDADGHSLPLATAVYRGNLNLVQLLVERGADVNAGWGVLQRALQNGHKDVATYLRSVGAKTAAELGWIPENDPSQFLKHLSQLGEVAPLSIQEIIQGDPPISLHLVKDENNDQYLVTEGMATLPMTVPPGYEEYQFAELAFYLRDDWPLDAKSLEDPQYMWPIGWLRQIARYPHHNQTWLGGQHAIIANGEPPEPLGPRTKMSCLLLIVNPTAFGKWVRPDGNTVLIYDVIPIYSEERDFEKRHGIEALLGKFQEYGITPMMHPRRVNTALL